MSFSFGAAVQSALPQRLIGRIVYRASRSRVRWLKSALISGFCRLYRIKLSEAEVEDPAAYASFNDFFTRRLKTAARPIPQDETALISPVDGRLTEFGQLEGDQLLQAKGMHYSLSEFLNENRTDIESFEGGHYATVYLAPHNYHRVHAPARCRLQKTRYIEGRRFSVNAATARAVPGLFCRNERVALWLDCRAGPSILVMVGAFNVSSLSTTSLGEIESGPGRTWTEPASADIAAGEELGRFNLGSTVVLLFARGTVRFDETLTAGQALRMGERIGSLVPEDPSAR